MEVRDTPASASTDQRGESEQLLRDALKQHGFKLVGIEYAGFDLDAAVRGPKWNITAVRVSRVVASGRKYRFPVAAASVVLSVALLSIIAITLFRRTASVPRPSTQKPVPRASTPSPGLLGTSERPSHTSTETPSPAIVVETEGPRNLSRSTVAAPGGPTKKSKPSRRSQSQRATRRRGRAQTPRKLPASGGDPTDSRPVFSALPVPTVPATPNLLDYETLIPLAPPPNSYDVIIHGPLVEALSPEAPKLRVGSVESVYIDVGASKAWILEMGVGAQAEARDTGSHVVRLPAPQRFEPAYPIEIHGLDPGAQWKESALYIIVQGVITKEGSFARLQSAPEEILAALQKWRFRPAMLGPEPVEVEMLLAIPRGSDRAPAGAR